MEIAAHMRGKQLQIKSAAWPLNIDYCWFLACLQKELFGKGNWAMPSFPLLLAFQNTEYFSSTAYFEWTMHHTVNTFIVFNHTEVPKEVKCFVLSLTYFWRSGLQVILFMLENCKILISFMIQKQNSYLQQIFRKICLGIS